MNSPLPSGRSADDAERSPSTSLLRLTAAILARWRLVAACGLLGAVIAAGWALVAAPRFRSSTRFALEEQRGLSGAGGLAALAGQLGGGSLGGMRSLQFYAEVLTGRHLLERIALDSFAEPGTDARRSLVEILGFREDSPERTLAAAVDFLHDRAVTTTTNERTGTISFDVVLHDPQLAADVSRRLFERLEEFNADSRNSAAAARRRFAEREIVRARSELADAEADLRRFLESNRGGLDAPRLVFGRQRLERRIDVLNEVYGSLSTELQEARIDEVRDTPAFTLIEPPQPAPYREFPQRTRMTLIGGVFGGALALVWIALRASGWSAGRIDPVGYDALRSALGRRPA